MSAAPIRGSVRMHHGFDRRLRQPLPEKPKPTLLLEEEAPASPPQADARDALEDPMVQMCKFLRALPQTCRCRPAAGLEAFLSVEAGLPC